MSSMPFAHRRLARAILALLIVTALAAGHQHRLLAPASAEATVSQVRDVAHSAARLSDCAVCRALQSTEPALAVVSDRLTIRAEPFGEAECDRPISSPRTQRSPRGPPALQA